VVNRTGPAHHLGAVAGALAVLGTAVHEPEPDLEAVADQMIAAVTTARPLESNVRSRSFVLSVPSIDRHADLTSSALHTDSLFLRPATVLLRQAGCDVQAHPALLNRLAATLDVAVNHWTAGARPGAGLPEFPSEHQMRSTKRLGAQLGADRDLLHLIYGPQPGRGRPLQVARQRGLTYWVALTLAAEQLGQPTPVAPLAVTAHWHRELSQLRAVTSVGAETDGVPDSWDVPTA
jgi:hypothetical protein